MTTAAHKSKGTPVYEKYRVPSVTTQYPRSSPPMPSVRKAPLKSASSASMPAGAARASTSALRTTSPGRGNTIRPGVVASLLTPERRVSTMRPLLSPRPS